MSIAIEVLQKDLPLNIRYFSCLVTISVHEVPVVCRTKRIEHRHNAFRPKVWIPQSAGNQVGRSVAIHITDSSISHAQTYQCIKAMQGILSY